MPLHNKTTCLTLVHPMIINAAEYTANCVEQFCHATVQKKLAERGAA